VDFGKENILTSTAGGGKEYTLISKCRNAGKKVSPISASSPVLNFVRPAAVFRHQRWNFLKIYGG
jgi:hypothetical protein